MVRSKVDKGGGNPQDGMHASLVRGGARRPNSSYEWQLVALGSDYPARWCRAQASGTALLCKGIRSVVPLLVAVSSDVLKP